MFSEVYSRDAEIRSQYWTSSHTISWGPLVHQHGTGVTTWKSSREAGRCWLFGGKMDDLGDLISMADPWSGQRASICVKLMSKLRVTGASYIHTNLIRPLNRT